MYPTHIADSCAVLVMPNVKVGMEVQNFFSPLSLHDLLRYNFTCKIMINILEGLIFRFLAFGLFQVKVQLVSSFYDGLRYLFLDCRFKLLT
jgi:hypothetical protein